MPDQDKNLNRAAMAVGLGCGAASLYLFGWGDGALAVAGAKALSVVTVSCLVGITLRRTPPVQIDPRRLGDADKRIYGRIKLASLAVVLLLLAGLALLLVAIFGTTFLNGDLRFRRAAVIAFGFLTVAAALLGRALQRPYQALARRYVDQNSEPSCNSEGEVNGRG